MDDGSLRRRVREAIESGRLPDRFPDELLGGPSSGANCAVCGQSTEGGMELELVYTHAAAGRRSFCAHPQCLPLFQSELQAMIRQLSGLPASPASKPAEAAPPREGRVDAEPARWRLA